MTAAQDTDEPAISAVADELRRHDISLAEELLDALLAYDSSLDPAVWGDGPPRAEVVSATVHAHEISRQARQQVLAASLTRNEAAERLGVGPQRISSLVEDGELVALTERGRLRLPAWQFHPDTERGRLTGIDKVAVAAAKGIVALTDWMEHPNGQLAGRTPARALLDGDVDAVVTAARTGA